jgi:hypothetical protein
MRRMLATGLAMLLAAVPAAAQHQGHGQEQQGQMQGRMGGGMQGGMGPLSGQLGRYAPTHLLKMKEMLTLTAEQVAELTAIQAAAKQAEDEAHAPAHAAGQSLRKALTDGADAATLKQYFQAHHTGMGNVQWARVEAAMQARAVLTEAQRGHVEGMKH